MITVPPPTFEDNNFSDAAVWNLISGATAAGDQFGGFKATGVSTSSRVAHLGTKPIADGSGSKHSSSCWFSTTNSTATSVLMSQRDSGGAPNKAMWDIILNASGLINPSFFSSVNASDGISGNSLLSFNDGVLRNLIITVDGNDLNIYINGVEVDYLVQDNVMGAGFTGVPASAGDNLTALGFSGSGFGLVGVNTNLKFWQGTTLTDAEVFQEFKNQEGMIINTLTTGSLYASGSLYKD